MRRLLLGILVLAGACAGAFALLAGGAGGASGASGERTYTVVLDNAFGLVQGGDVKVAGVRAGTVSSFDLDADNHALVKIKITQGGFGSFRTDVTCESRPQSLVGEYFLDCAPGTAAQTLRDGATIPLSHTQSTIAPDLLLDIMRLPERERLRVIVGELGAGVAGRGADLNAALRRAVPALTQTNRVLELLGTQNRTLRDLIQSGDQVVTALARSRKDISRFVVATGRTTTDIAERAAANEEALRQLPGFLEQLQPAMAQLGRVADQTTPTLSNLQASASNLRRLFTDLEPFARNAKPALNALGDAGRTGRDALVAAKPTIRELGRFAKPLPELSKNLNIVLHDLDDRGRRVENDPRTPGQLGQSGATGYTGLEALLMYVFTQTVAINSFDQNGHVLRVNAYLSECSAYQNAQTLLKKLASEPSFKHCESWLGPNQPGINQPDYSTSYNPAHGPVCCAAQIAAFRAAHPNDTNSTAPVSVPRTTTPSTTTTTPAGSTPAATAPSTLAAPAPPKPPIDLKKTLKGLLGGDGGGGLLGGLLGGNSAQPSAANTQPAASGDSARGLLTYLLGP